jgi:Gamma tubulin complex component C-terminal
MRSCSQQFDYVALWVNLQVNFCQVDVIESQYSIMLNKIQSTRDFEAIRLAHGQFLASLHSQCFMHVTAVTTIVLCLTWLWRDLVSKVRGSSIGVVIVCRSVRSDSKSLLAVCRWQRNLVIMLFKCRGQIINYLLKLYNLL